MKSGTLTFLAGQPISQQVVVNLVIGSRTDPEEFFWLNLTNPVNANLTNSVATCTIKSRANLTGIYLPYIRR
jgi:hypothetical protein